MSSLKLQNIEIEQIKEIQKPNGEKIKITNRGKIDTEDIIAILAGIVAIIIAIGMVIEKIPINELTVGVLGFSGIGAVIAEIIKARKKKQKNSKLTVPKRR